MRYMKADLLQDVVTSYDQTKTTIQGRVFQKIVDGKAVLGPPLTKFIDVQTEAALTPVGPAYCSPSGRLFIPNGIASGIGQIALYSYNLVTGSYSYVGKIQYVMPNAAATTHTIRSIKVDDTGGTWKIFISTVGSVLVNGGTFMINGLTQADFTPIGFPTIPFANGSDQKAVYFLQGLGFAGATNNITSAVSLILEQETSKIFVMNGVAATYQYHVFDYSVAPNNPGQTATISIAVPGVVTSVGHGFSVNDQVTLSTTGALPTGLVAGTVYFVRNPTANTFELSATTGGAAINTSGTQSGVHTVRRAFGITTALPYYQTGNLPALAGTLLLTNAGDKKTPLSGSNAGLRCASFGTNSTFYEGRLSELTAGVTTWPSLRSANALGSGVDITTPTPTFFQYSETTDRIIYVTNTTRMVVKPFANNQIDKSFGSLSNTYQETFARETVNYGMAALIGLESQEGWLFAVSSQVGQRGIFVMDFRSDDLFGFSYLVTKVLDLKNATLKFISTIEALFDETSPMIFYFRNSGFGSISGGWIQINYAEFLDLVASGQQGQFKIGFDIVNADVATPAQICELLIGLDPLTLNSEHWESSVTKSTSGSPTDVVFRLKKLYTGSVPALRFLATDLSDVLLVDHDTVNENANFRYSTDGGMTWLPVGTIPNTVGTLVRYRFTSPPGVDVRPALKED